MPEKIVLLTPKQRAYDRYVSSGSGDVCFTFGMNGKCGPDCPEFGMRDGCRDEATKLEDEDDG